MIDNEVIRYMRRTLHPLEVNEETLALDTIRRAGIGGNYLIEEHTLKHFRDEQFFSDLFETKPWSSAHAPEIKGMDSRAQEIARLFWEEKPEPVIDTDQIKAIEK